MNEISKKKSPVNKLINTKGKATHNTYVISINQKSLLISGFVQHNFPMLSAHVRSISKYNLKNSILKRPQFSQVNQTKKKRVYFRTLYEACSLQKFNFDMVQLTYHMNLIYCSLCNN